MSLQLLTPPEAEPVTVDEMKKQLNLDHDEDDVYLGQLILAARRYAETCLNRQLVSATWVKRFDRFPCYTIHVPLPPLVSVTTLKYIDTGGTLQTLVADTDYQVDVRGEPGRICPAYQKQWPSTRDVMNAVELTFVAGYGEPDDVPEEIRTGIKLLATTLYENRGLTAEQAMQISPVVGTFLMSAQWGCYA